MRNFHIISHMDSIELAHNENGRITGASYISLDRYETVTDPFLQHHVVLFVIKGDIDLTCKHYSEKTVREGSMTFLSRGGLLHIKAGNARTSLLVFGFDEVAIRTSCKRAEGGKPVTEAAFRLLPCFKYVRVTVRDAHGKHACTNAYFLDELGIVE